MLNSLTVDMYVTCDLAFQAMVLGKELMAGWWCILQVTEEQIPGQHR